MRLRFNSCASDEYSYVSDENCLALVRLCNISWSTNRKRGALLPSGRPVLAHVHRGPGAPLRSEPSRRRRTHLSAAIRGPGTGLGTHPGASPSPRTRPLVPSCGAKPARHQPCSLAVKMAAEQDSDRMRPGNAHRGKKSPYICSTHFDFYILPLRISF